MLKKLPIGIQVFKDITKENYFYIDKTKEVLDIINDDSKYLFLSRPRRFGKSLFLDTLKSAYEGEKELFEDLYIYDKYDFKEYPVIKIEWRRSLQTIEELNSVAYDILKDNQERLGVVCEHTKDMAGCFEELIKKTYKKYNKRVVVLIDEYDKPILEVIEDNIQAQKNRNYIKGFYSVLKASGEYIEKAFLTGVSKFSRASIFSDLNMIQDISLNPKYGNICGYTQNDIETKMIEYLKDVDLKKLQKWYNGYNFLKDKLYNPFDILLFISNNFAYKNYWFSTATPTFLIKLIQKNRYFLPRLSNVKIGDTILDSFDIDNIDFEVILFQAGYLTIDKTITNRRGLIEYKLKLPNEEVKYSFNDILIDFFTNQHNKSNYQDDLYNALKSADLDCFKQSLKAIFSSIPYNNYVNNKLSSYEGYYASVIYIYLQSLGLDIIGEDVTNRGRIDLTIKLDNAIYILEFKVGSDDALTQIKEKKYHEKYMSENKEIYLIGINFDEKDRNISKFEWEKVSNFMD